MAPVRTLAVMASCLALVGCGGGGSSTADSSSAATSPSTSANAYGYGDTPSATPTPAESALTVTTTPTDLGEILTLDGSTLYAFTEDSPGEGRSTCTGGCATAWPPVPAGTEADSTVEGERSVVIREDGTEQLAINGWPLYAYAADADGETSGQGVGGVWFVVDGSGELVRR